MIKKFENNYSYAANSAIAAANARLNIDPSTQITVTISLPLEGFYTIEDTMDLLHVSKTTAQNIFNMKEFPACDFGRGKVVSKQAFYEFFSRRQSKDDYRYWREKKGA